MSDSIKHIIAIASGKGGVGKSTVTANLAAALHSQGHRVGILDADIYGPSQAALFGVAASTRPQSDDGKHFKPLLVQGLALMSMAFLVDQTTPMIWRGPMAAGAFQQLLNQTLWDQLDYLLIDMPPGTGDIQLTLAQKVKVAGAVIVTTPQDIALLDARRGIEMFRQVKVPVLGVVENMSLHQCSACGHAEPIFGEGGGAQVAEAYQTQLLGKLPLALSVRQHSDQGSPIVFSEPDSAAAQHFQQIAGAVHRAVSQNDADTGPEIVFTD